MSKGLPPKPRLSPLGPSYSGETIWRCCTHFPPGDWREIVDIPGIGLSVQSAYMRWLGRNAGAHPSVSRAAVSYYR